MKDGGKQTIVESGFGDPDHLNLAEIQKLLTVFGFKLATARGNNKTFIANFVKS